MQPSRDRVRTVPPGVEQYAAQLVQSLQVHLGDDLLGAYLVGSAALGGYVPGRSDIDIQAVCAKPLPQEMKQRIVDTLAHPSLPCPTRGCEFVLYARANIAHPAGAAFELNLNSGPEMPFHVRYEPSQEPAHWFILDRAIARERAIPLVGPEPQELFGEIPRPRLLDAILASLRWHLANDTTGYSSVLNACRSLLYAEEGRWASKVDAANWALERAPEEQETLERALALRATATDKALSREAVQRLLEAFMRRVQRARDALDHPE